MLRRLAPLLLGLGACAGALPPASVFITVKPSARLVRRAFGVQVHLETLDPLSLQMYDISTWKTVCEAPCNQAVAAGEVYRITRQGRAVAEEFTLDAPSGSQITIAVGPTQHIEEKRSTPWFTTMY
jgi:hypothetical protein